MSKKIQLLYLTDMCSLTHDFYFVTVFVIKTTKNSMDLRFLATSLN